MLLSKLAAKPQLVKLIIDDAELVASYSENNEPLEFYTWDRQPIETFMKLAAAQDASPGEMIDIVRKLILNDKGEEIITNGASLPGPLLIQAISKIVTVLGK